MFCAVWSWTVSFHFTPAQCACTAGGVEIDLSIKRLSTEQFQSGPLSLRAKDLIIVIYQMCPFDIRKAKLIDNTFKTCLVALHMQPETKLNEDIYF